MMMIVQVLASLKWVLLVVVHVRCEDCDDRHMDWIEMTRGLHYAAGASACVESPSDLRDLS